LANVMSIPILLTAKRYFSLIGNIQISTAQSTLDRY
jgi:hypothetical protein